MNLGKSGAALALAMLLSVCACSSSSSVASNKSADYKGTLQKVLLVTKLDNTLHGPNLPVFGDEPASDTKNFIDLMKGGLENCGVQVQPIIAPPNVAAALTSSQSLSLQGADSLLYISWTKDQVAGAGHATDYLASLFDASSKAVVWKATITLHQRFNAPQELADTLISRMKQDQLINANCVSPKSAR